MTFFSSISIGGRGMRLVMLQNMTERRGFPISRFLYAQPIVNYPVQGLAHSIGMTGYIL